MLEKFKAAYELQKAKRAERKAQPWGKKQKIIVFSIFAALILYFIVSAVISSASETGEGFSVPSLNLTVNGVDVILLCVCGLGFAIFKIRSYIKRRKENEK